MLTQERLKELLHYDPATGVFTWRVAPNGRVKAGAVAGNIDPQEGYVRIGIGGRLYRAHRLAWLYVHGAWPSQEIDHRFGVRHDNRISELREATKSENLQNQRRARADSKSGVLGVHWDKKNRKWRAQIRLGGCTSHLGLFSGKEEAHTAYLGAKAQRHPFSTLKVSA